MTGIRYADIRGSVQYEKRLEPFLIRYREVTGKSERTGYRRLQALRERWIPTQVADELCLTIGLHPCQVWRNW